MLLNFLAEAAGIFNEAFASGMAYLGAGLAMIAGGLSLLAFFPALLKKDGNEDGVADIMQKSQNVYAQSSQKIDKITDKANVIAEIAQLLS